MGAGFHGGFGYSKGKEKILEENCTSLIKKYGISNGYFGQAGKNVRVIESKDNYHTADSFYKTISSGGIEYKLKNGHGVMTILPDGTRIVYRVITKTQGSPAIEISISSSRRIKNQKIHFIKKEQDL